MGQGEREEETLTWAGPRKMPLPEMMKPYCGAERLPQKPGWMAADLEWLGKAAGAWWSPQTTPHPSSASPGLPQCHAGECGHCQVATLCHLM